MATKLHLWLALVLVGVGASTWHSSNVSPDVALSQTKGEGAVKMTSARRRRRRSKSSSSSSSSDLTAINAALKSIQAEVKKLKESFMKGLDKLEEAVEERKTKAPPSPGPAPPTPPAPPAPPAPKPPSGSSGKVPVGHYVAFHNAKANRFLRMHGHGKMDASESKDVDKFPKTWGWEKFYSKDVGDGKMAFYCASHGKWMSAHQGTKMWSSNPGYATRNPGGWERFTIVPVGGGKIKIKTHRGTFVRMSGSKCDHTGSGSDDEITFTAVDLGKTSPPQPPRRG